jgi:hypothetical protein
LLWQSKLHLDIHVSRFSLSQSSPAVLAAGGMSTPGDYEAEFVRDLNNVSTEQLERAVAALSKRTETLASRKSVAAAHPQEAAKVVHACIYSQRPRRQSNKQSKPIDKGKAARRMTKAATATGSSNAAIPGIPFVYKTPVPPIDAATNRVPQVGTRAGYGSGARPTL